MWGVIWQRNSNKILIYIPIVIPDWTGNGVVESRQGYTWWRLRNSWTPWCRQPAGEQERGCRLKVERYRTFRMSHPTRHHISKADPLSWISIWRYLICHFVILPLCCLYPGLSISFFWKEKGPIKALKSEAKKLTRTNLPNQSQN